MFKGQRGCGELEIDMTDDDHAGDLVGAYVIEVCPPDEARSVGEHASRCPTCAAEIAELSRVVDCLGMAIARSPFPALRSRVFSAALAARPAGPPQVSLPGTDHATADEGEAHPGRSADVGDGAEVSRLVEPYRAQVNDLDQLLTGLSPPQWLLPAGPHRSVRELVVHLRGNDALIAEVAGLDAGKGALPSTSDIRLDWRAQAQAVIDVVGHQGARLLHQEVRLAGSAGIRGPVREALIQRGFETWIHADDIRAALRMPARTPSAQQLSDIVNFALRLLPAAMDAAGRAHPFKAIRLVLTGMGGGTRLANLSTASPACGTVVAELSLPAERFCRILAGRLVASPTNAEVDGDVRAATDFLTVAAMMGCE
jgi:uncharacterized protein (TIGR03083 family)